MLCSINASNPACMFSTNTMPDETPNQPSNFPPGAPVDSLTSDLELFLSQARAPRYDLREAAFRRYERYIARALESSYTFDPMDEAQGQRSYSARTFYVTQDAQRIAGADATISATKQALVVELCKRLQDQSLKGKFFIRCATPNEIAWTMELAKRFRVTLRMETAELVSIIAI